MSEHVHSDGSIHPGPSSCGAPGCVKPGQLMLPVEWTGMFLGYPIADWIKVRTALKARALSDPRALVALLERLEAEQVVCPNCAVSGV